MNEPIDISNVILSTERLILRPWRQDDLEDFFSYASEDGVGQMAGWKPHESREESQAILQRFIDRKKVFAIEYRGKAIGSLGIEEYDEKIMPELADKKCREIGYVLAKPYWGQGLMPEAVKRVIRWLFEEVGLDVILCAHFDWNSQSRRVQEKCGFTPYKKSLFKTALGTTENDIINILTRRQAGYLEYRLPELSDQDVLEEYIREHHDHGEQSLSASHGLTSTDFADWVSMTRHNAFEGNAEWGTSLLYLCFSKDRLVGLLSIRPELPEELRNRYGDIGYGVRPSERNKGYATEMLKQGLAVCRQKGMNEVIVGCLKDNEASAATIRKNGGLLIAENENYKPGRICQYYSIRIKPEKNLRQEFESENISYVEVSEALADEYLVMVNDNEHVNAYLTNTKPFTRDQEIIWVQKKLAEKAPVFSLIEKKSGEFIGNVELMDDSDTSRELGIALTYAKQDLGYGTEAIKAIVRYGFEEMGLEKIVLRAKITNGRAIHVYEKCGFREYDRNDTHLFMEITPDNI
ncbi:MAG: GNAT family N-acetyltransferase [Erysipelotrichaceae bacterium]|nr:GNAT family N-acetyltransferase [Erysipelotrichaceae bacterium]